MSLRCGDDSYRVAGEEGCCSIRSDECLDSFGHHIGLRGVEMIVDIEEGSDSAGHSCLGGLVLEEGHSVGVGIVFHTSP